MSAVGELQAGGGRPAVGIGVIRVAVAQFAVLRGGITVVAVEAEIRRLGFEIHPVVRPVWMMTGRAVFGGGGMLVIALADAGQQGLVAFAAQRRALGDQKGG